MATPIDGGPTFSIAQNQNSPTAIRVDSGGVYWTTRGSVMMLPLPLDGGLPLVVATGQSSPSGLCVDPTFVYWTNLNSGTVMKAPK